MHPLQAELEEQFTGLFNSLDNHLEEKYGSRWPLHPNRLKRGQSSSPVYDGLFSTAAEFTSGYGSSSGRGYVIDIDFRTLSSVSSLDKEEIYTEAISFLEKQLPIFFPTRKLKIIKDSNLYKIVGDFSLGSV